MSQRLFVGILFLTAASSTTSSGWADDLPPYFSTLELSAEQSKSLTQLAEEHSSILPDRLSPETERAFFADCWKVLTEEQRRAWNNVGRENLVVPKEWNELDLTEEQEDLLARPCAIFRTRINHINGDLRELFGAIKDAQKSVFLKDNKDISELTERTEALIRLQKRAQKLADTRKVWETALDSDMRECLTGTQRRQLLVIETSTTDTPIPVLLDTQQLGPSDAG